jgi:hypothetical protein
MSHPACDNAVTTFGTESSGDHATRPFAGWSGPICSAVGDYDGVITTFAQCEKALRAAGITPAPSTRTLLNQLRR